MANFGYKKSTSTTMKLKGVLNTERMTIEFDDSGASKLSTLLSDFKDELVEITVKVSSSTELEMPEDITNEEDEDYED